MLLGTLNASLLENLLTGKDTAGEGTITMSRGKHTITAGQVF